MTEQDPERNKETVRRALEELGNGPEESPLEAYRELYADEVLDHPWWFGPVDPMTGQPAELYRATPELLREGHAQIRGRFPDGRTRVDELIAAGDRVIARYTTTATHRGGQPVVIRNLDIYRLEGGKIAEVWNCWDRLGLTQQLGLIPDSLTLLEKESQL